MNAFPTVLHVVTIGFVATAKNIRYICTKYIHVSERTEDLHVLPNFLSRHLNQLLHLCAGKIVA